MNSQSSVADVVCDRLDSLKDLQQSLRNESQAERFDETDETFWKVVTEKYPYARAIYNAFKDNSNARLFIIVVPDRTSSKIHFITKQELSPELIITRIDALIEAKTRFNEITQRWKELGKKIQNNEEQDVIDSGSRFHDHLLMGYLFSIDAEFENGLNEPIVSDELKEKFRAKGFPLSKPTLSSTKENREWEITDEKRKYALKIEDETLNIYLKSKEKWLNSYIGGKNIVPQCANPFGVWVYCADKDIYPLWEWLHDSSFFWGDKFHIVRIPEECDLSDCQVSISNEVIILAANTGDLTVYADKIQEVLEEAGVSECTVILSPENTKLDIPNVCIISASGDDTYTTKLETAFSKKKKIFF